MKKYSFLIIIIVLISCDSNKEVAQKNKNQKETSIVFKHKKPLVLTSLASKNIGDWKEYTVLDEFIKKFLAISPNEALSNALELKSLVKNLKDSIRPKELKIPAFKARINVLENESLRLADMTYISAITYTEVNNQVAKFLLIYTSVNSKINNVYRRIQFENNVVIKSDYIGLDSTKINTNSKKRMLVKEDSHLQKREFKKR